jgi:hypothetical protein
MRHALDADHVAAVSTIVSEQRGLRGSALVGGFWGLGHALALLVAGGALLAWRVQVTERVAGAAGIRRRRDAGAAGDPGDPAVRRAACGCMRTGHTHDGREHVHIHAHREGELHAKRRAPPRPRSRRRCAARCSWGMLHGLAGSAAPALLVMGAAPSFIAGLAYLAALAAGSRARHAAALRR